MEKASASQAADDQVLTILMTAPDPEVGEHIVRKLLDEELIACGNVIPGAVSLYRWEGQIHRDQEVVVVLKTVRRLISEVLERAEDEHPYDVPELLVHEVVDGAPRYLDWVKRECR